jgi:serine/threonine-protein kinase
MDPWSEWDREWKDEVDGFKPGDEVGPYELLCPAASGGMATVWAGRRRGTQGTAHVVAVKLVSDALHSDDDVRAMFLDEARTASRILHPNVVEIFACGEVRQRPYIAMEWIEGESLAKIVSAQKGKGSLLPLGWVLHVASAACAGLHAAHEVRDDAGELLHLIHRDVTPQNVMIGFDGTVKVVDFGVAKSRAQTQVSRAGVIKGKTAYFSPEQVSGEQIDRRSDLFSFGCLLYLLVTGHPPFRGRGFLEVMNQITTRVPQRPIEIMPDLLPDLDRIIVKALAKDPAERYQTAAEIRRDLDQVRAQLGERMKAKEVGALVSALIPGVEEERRAKITTAASELDLRPVRDPEPVRVVRPEDATEVMMRNVAMLLAGPSEPVSTSGPKSSPRPDPSSSRRSDPNIGRRSDPDLGRRLEASAARRSDPDLGRRLEASAARRSDPDLGRRSDPGAARRSDPSAARRSDPGTGRRSDPGVGRKAEATAGRRSDPTNAQGSGTSLKRGRRDATWWLALAMLLLAAVFVVLLAVRR